MILLGEVSFLTATYVKLAKMAALARGCRHNLTASEKV